VAIVQFVVASVVLIGALVAGATWWLDSREVREIVEGKPPTADQVEDGLSEEATRAALRNVCLTGVGVAGFPAYAPATAAVPFELNYGDAYSLAERLAENGPVLHPVAVVYVEQLTTRHPLVVEYSDHGAELRPAIEELQLVGCVSDAPNTFCDRPNGAAHGADRMLITVHSIATGAEVGRVAVEYPYLNQQVPCDVRLDDLDNERNGYEMTLAVMAKTP